MQLTADGASVTVADNALRDLRIRGHRVLDAITVAVRDEAWGTYPIHVAVTSATGRRAVLHGVHGDVFRWDGSVEVTADQIRFALHGTVLRDVDSPRIGLCLLHPLALAGRGFHTDTGPGAFGIAIDPHPPASGFRTLRYDAGVPVGIELSDPFEMEDHRNWSDPGWKSYSPPLAAGGVRRFRAGETVEQVVTVRGRLTTVPSIDRYGSSSVDLFEGAPLAFTGGAATLVGRSPAWLRAAATALAEHGSVTRVAVFDPATHTTAPGTAALVRAVLRDLGCAAPVGGGSRAHFAELNRLTSIPDDWDFVTFPITAQAHHDDTPSVLATVRSHPYLIDQAERIAPGRPVVVAPLALRRRAGANSPAAPADPPDPRERARAGAAWLLGSVIGLRRAAALTVLLDTPAPAGRRPSGPSGAGAVTPAGALLHRLVGLRGRPFIAVPTGDPRLVAATVPGEATFVANLGDTAAMLHDTPIAGHAVAVLDDEGPL